MILLHDKRTADKLTEAIVQQLREARSFDQANRLAALLSAEAPLLTPSSKPPDCAKPRRRTESCREHSTSTVTCPRSRPAGCRRIQSRR